MKWIGQHIYDLIARFRSEVYLEGITSGTPNAFISVDSNKKILTGIPAIESVGTITSGQWRADAISTAYGGTGLTSYTQGDILYYNTGGTLSKLGIGTAGQVLKVNSGATAPEWGTDAAGLSFNGSTSNGILTYGNSTTADVESNLTFDGTDLLLDSTGSLGTYGSNVLHLKNTNASAGGPGLRFEKLGKTGADGDLISQINWQGLNDADELTTFAKVQIKVGDASDGAESGQFILTNANFVGDITGNVTGNASGTSATVTSGTQAAITTCSNLTTVGTIGSGTWQGTAIASAYLDADTMHLSSAQTVVGNKTFNNLRVQNEESDGNPQIRFYEGSDNGSNFATLKASDSIASNYEVSLPTSAGTIQLQPSEGAFANGDKTKLDAIEASADVTDATNVTAAGALMDSELTDLAGIKSLDTSTLVTLAGTQSITGGKTFTKPLILDGDKSVTAGSDGVTLHVDAQDITDSSTSGSGTAAAFNHIVVENPRLMATNSNVTTTNASTVYIKGARVASTNQTITNAYSFYVAGGNSYFNNNVTVGGDLDVTGNILPGITYVKILPSDFVPDDAGRPAMIDDTGSDRWLESHGTAKLFAYVDIPVGFKATHVDIYGSATSAVTVYEANINSKTVTSKGTGNIGTQINITDVNSDATNYILIELAQASGEEVYGGKLTIAKI